MTFLPIVEMELRQAARRSRTYLVRWGGALLATLIGLGLLSPSFWGVLTPVQTGRALFDLVSWIAFGYALLVGVFSTADCLSEEKREGTLGLLLLTRLSGHDVVLGKLVSRSLNSFYGLLAVLPILGLPLLFGGVTAGEFWRMNLVLLNTFFFSVSAGLWVSARSYSGRNAIGATVLLLALVTFALPLVFGGIKDSWGTVFLLISSATPFWYSTDTAYAASFDLFWISLAVQNCAGWLALFWAGRVVPHSWQQGVDVSAPSRGREVWSRLWRGNVGGRQRYRQRWLDENPILWLARREDFFYRMYLPYFILAGLV